MSKKKDKDSWKAKGEKYKNSKREPLIEENETPHIKKKKKKKVKRSSHKHIYVPAIYHRRDKDRDFICLGSHCKICGRVENMSYAWYHLEEKIAKFKKQYPDYVEINLPKEWDWFKDKCIPL